MRDVTKDGMGGNPAVFISRKAISHVLGEACPQHTAIQTKEKLASDLPIPLRQICSEMIPLQHMNPTFALHLDERTEPSAAARMKYPIQTLPHHVVSDDVST